MTWNPFDKQSNAPGAEVRNKIDAEGKPDPNKPAEKTPAELIAESVTSSLKPLVDKLDSFGQRLDSIEQGAPKRTPKPEGQPESQPKPAEVASVWDDEAAAFNQRLTPIVLHQMEVEARLVKNEIKQEYVKAGFGDMWDQFAAEIDQSLSNSPVVGGDGKPVRGNPDYIRNVVDMIFGRAARKAGMKFNAQEKTFFLESGTGPSGAEHTPPADDGMTPAQRRVFERMNVPLDRAKEVIKKLEFVS